MSYVCDMLSEGHGSRHQPNLGIMLLTRFNYFKQMHFTSGNLAAEILILPRCILNQQALCLYRQPSLEEFVKLVLCLELALYN